MHTLRILALALGLLGVCLIVSRLLVGERGLWVVRACQVFIPVWFVGAAVNMWIGVTRAGYTVAEELPIFVLVFGVPAGIAAVIWRKAIGG